MNRLKAKELVKLALFTAILFLTQISIAGIPNVELVSLLIILYTIHLRKKVFYIIYLFALLEGLFYGFGIWWFMYLYVWSILVGITMLASKNTSVIFWSILAGAFGLFFGFLCSIPYFLIGGFSMGFSYFIAGIPYDIMHCIGNVAVTLVLFRPLSQIFIRIKD